MNPRHKGTSATTCTTSTDQTIEQSQREREREREAWPAHRELHQNAQEEEENNRKEHQRVGAAFRESGSKCAHSRFAGKECASAMDKQRSFGESVCDTLYRARLHGLELGMYVYYYVRITLIVLYPNKSSYLLTSLIWWESQCFLFFFIFCIENLAKLNPKLAKLVEFTLAKKKTPNFFVEKWRNFARKNQEIKTLGPYFINSITVCSRCE
jgi:hypothetical protein